MQIIGNEVGCLGVDVMRRVEDYVKKGKKGAFYFALASNFFRLNPSNRRDLLGLECALSSFKGEIPRNACKMPLPLLGWTTQDPTSFKKTYILLVALPLWWNFFQEPKL